MSSTLQDLGIDRLSTDDRLALAEAIWESVAREIERAPLSPRGGGKNWNGGWRTASTARTRSLRGKSSGARQLARAADNEPPRRRRRRRAGQ